MSSLMNDEAFLKQAGDKAGAFGWLIWLALLIRSWQV